MVHAGDNGNEYYSNTSYEQPQSKEFKYFEDPVFLLCFVFPLTIFIVMGFLITLFNMMNKNG